MDNTRKEFVEEASEYISNICQNTLSDSKNHDRVLDVLGIYKKDLHIILKKIVVALPDYIFLKQLPDIYSEVMEYLSREYILFQCQEDIESPYFANNLANFIYEVTNTINQNYNYHGR
jgi:hypothetical protein